MSAKLEVAKLISKLAVDITNKNPDNKHNIGRLVGEAYFWDEVAAAAKKKSDNLWDAMAETHGFIIDESAEPGEYSLGKTPSFTVLCKVSEPRKTFKMDVAVSAVTEFIKTRFKKPIAEATIRELLERCKIGDKGAKTYSIAPQSE